MYFDEHPPPHFHAIYGKHKMQIELNPIRVLRGRLLRRAESMVIEWAALQQQELIQNWERLRHDQMAQKDVDYFKQVRVDPEIGTLVWPRWIFALIRFIVKQQESLCRNSKRLPGGRPNKHFSGDGDMRVIDESGEDYLYPAE